ncbi:MAG: UvrD-helicase domain-containing protein [Proteobacteria bacterium]|nr:UvrD-helicase domain-containing protein [Pseudomonadota bacterium]
MDVPLNPEQRAAVDHGDGPLMVLAGAGTGKTRVLVQRIARLVETGTPPWEILAVTFTNKAAGEMRARLRELLGEAANAMWIGTFHSTCARLLRRYGEAVGLTRSFVIFDDDDQVKLIAKLLKETGTDEQVTARTILSRIDRAKNRGDDPRKRIDGFGSPYDDIIDRVFPLYQAQLAKENAVDFNDLLLKVLDLFTHEQSARALRVRFRHVLVDEFQDTNLVQYSLVTKFSAATRNLTVVGDDDQSIYAWRGAEPRNLLDFDRDFPDAKVIKLEQNYRSTQTILDAANGVIRKNRDRHEKSLWTDRGGGELIETYTAGDERGEAYHVAYAIRRLLDEGPASPGEIAILYRTNAQSRVLEEHLRAARIPAKVVGAVSFFERKEVKDIIAYLRLLNNAAADSAFERVVNVPTRGLGDATVERLRAAARASGSGLFEAARLAARGDVSGIGTAPRRKLLGFVELVEGLRDVIAQGASVAETIIQIVDRSGLRAKLEADDNTEARDRLENLAELVTLASDFDDAIAEFPPDPEGEVEGEPAPSLGAAPDEASERPAAGIEGFLERIALSHASDESASTAPPGESVVLMTIHIAKGLEWPIVFITGLEDGLFPSLREREGQSEDAQIEEERRLAYVAITRARHRLFLSHARTRRVWGEIRMQEASRFLFDLPPDCVAVGRRSGTTTPPRSQPGSWARGSAVRGPGPARPSGTTPSGLTPPGIAPRRKRDEFDQRAPDDDLPVYRVDDDVPRTATFRSGDPVSHELHGFGKVIAVSGSGTDTKVIVEFPTVGRKTIYAKYLAAESN